MDDIYTASGDARIRNNIDLPVSAPCPDCKRTYTVSESVAVRVKDRPDPVWAGCIDCWVKRTGPEMCATFVSDE